MIPKFTIDMMLMLSLIISCFICGCTAVTFILAYDLDRIREEIKNISKYRDNITAYVLISVCSASCAFTSILMVSMSLFRSLFI